MQHSNSAVSLAAGMKSLPAADAAFADTQALWRFLSNPRVKPTDLAAPVLALAKLGIEQGCDGYALAVHDWSRLNYRTHTSKRDRVRMTHDTDVGYELQSTVLVADRDGSPIGAPTQNLRTAQGLLSSRWEGAQEPASHLDELSLRLLWLDRQGLGRALVHVVDREADSIRHLRAWNAQGSLWLVRVKDSGPVQWGERTVKLSEVGQQLSYERVRMVQHQGREAEQWVASTSVVVSKKAKPKKRLDAQGRCIGGTVPGAPLTARLVVSQVREASGKVLAQWYLLSNVDDSVQAATLALWYYWRWRIESYFKLLKGAGQQIEHWEQESAEAIFKRLLIASQACALAWRLMRAQGEFAEQTRAFLIRLSGRQMKRNTPVTASALLSGLYMLFAMNETLQHYSPEQIAQFVREARAMPP
ncbi:hypothetical protein WKW80_09105 [Variovorax humicola]|uniref:IS4 family transposase n=1 Tax=Variovorax humicola TaxID=1769758 RepID=A0ABU8VWK0_9BURK